jgi:hypothetical protein
MASTTSRAICSTKTLKFALMGSVGAAAFALPAMPAFAQDAADETSEDVIVVTARKQN